MSLTNRGDAAAAASIVRGARRGDAAAAAWKLGQDQRTPQVLDLQVERPAPARTVEPRTVELLAMVDSDDDEGDASDRAIVWERPASADGPARRERPAAAQGESPGRLGRVVWVEGGADAARRPGALEA